MRIVQKLSDKKYIVDDNGHYVTVLVEADDKETPEGRWVTSNGRKLFIPFDKKKGGSDYDVYKTLVKGVKSKDTGEKIKALDEKYPEFSGWLKLEK